MFRKFTKKRLLLAVTVVAALAIAGSALAYFTTSGTGSGSGTVGTATGWTVTTSTGTGTLYPDANIGGANIESIPYTVKNGGQGSENLTSVAIKIANSDGSAWSSQTNMSDPACTAADFSVDGAAIGTTATDAMLAGDYPAASSESGTVTVEMIDNTTANQDNCENVVVPLYLSAS
jgi:hypothetical protein